MQVAMPAEPPQSPDWALKVGSPCLKSQKGEDRSGKSRRETQKPPDHQNHWPL